MSSPSCEGSVPRNWLLSKFLRAAAAGSSAQSSRRLHSQSMVCHRGGTHNESSIVIAPSSEGSVPVNWLLSKFLRAAEIASAPPP